MYDPLVSDSEWDHFTACIFRNAMLRRLSQDYYENDIAGRQRAGRTQAAGRLVCAHSPDMVMEKLSPLLSEKATNDMRRMHDCWRRLTAQRFMPNDCFQDHRWGRLSANENHRMQLEGRQLVFRQIHDLVQGHILNRMDAGVAQAVAQASEDSRLALLYRLLGDHRRQTMVERSLRPQRLALPNFSEEEAAEAMEPEEDVLGHDHDYYRQPRGSRE